MAPERAVALAVDVDHALAQLLPAALEWHNSEHNTTLTTNDLTSDDWIAQLAGKKPKNEWLSAFHASEAFKTGVAAVDGAAAALRPLRKYFTMLAITQRPRAVEKATREWIDAHFRGVFDKLLFVDVDPAKNDVVARKKELFTEFRVKIAVGADTALVDKTSDSVAHAVVVGSVPWAKASANSKVVTVENWAKAHEAIEKMATDLALPAMKKVFKGPKIARYADDLVSISTKKPPAFYASMVNTKFTVQKQDTVRLQASETAISTAVQAAELLKTQNTASVAKISTRYLFKKFHSAPTHRVPAIEIVLQKVVA